MGRAVAHFGSLSFKRIVRLRGLNDLFDGNEAENGELKQAMNDLETVLGSYRGELTEPLQSMIRDLDRTGVMEAIAESAITQRDSGELFTAFHEICQKKFPKEARKFFNTLVKGTRGRNLRISS